MTVTLTWTTPTTRAPDANGVSAPLAIAEIKSMVISRNGMQLASVVPTGPTNTFNDTTPLTGSDTYTVDTVTTDNLVSAESNAATVTIVSPLPAATITDLVAVLAP